MSNEILPISTSRGRSLRTTLCATLVITPLIWLGLPTGDCLWPGSSRVQASANKRQTAQSVQQSDSLEPGKPIERELPGGQSHFYMVTMASGQYLRIAVSQRGIDVSVALFAPDGKKIGEADGEQAAEGAETISMIAEAAGAYRIEVRSAEMTAGTGRYEILIEALRKADAEDKYRVAAESIFRAAEKLENGDVEDKRKSIEKYHEALELYRRANDQQAAGQTVNNLGVVSYYLGEYRQALAKFNEALPIRRTSGDRRGEAETLTNLGATYTELGDLQKAMDIYSEALPILRAVGDRKVEAVTLGNIGKVYWISGETRKAMEKCNEALLIYTELGDRDGIAKTLTNIGVLHEVLGEAQEALAKFNEALPMLRAVGDRHEEGTTLNNIGYTLSSLGENRKAMEKYAEALRIRQAIGDRDGEATTLDNMGASYSSLGEKQKALEKHQEALRIRRTIGERNGEAASLNNIGILYMSLGEPQRALDKFNESLPIRLAVSDRGGEAITLNNIGKSYWLIGERQKALAKFNEAITICRAIGDRNCEAIVLNNIGLAHIALGERQEALATYNKALQISQTIGTRESAATILHNIGEAYLLAGEIPSALKTFNEALEIRRAISDRYGEAATLLGIARIEQKEGNLTRARRTIEQAIAIVESRRADIRNVKELQTSYFASRQDYYQTYIDILIEQHRQNPAAGLDAIALAVSERARARSLLELLTESRADIRQGIDNSLLERELHLQQLLNAKAAAQVALLNRKHTPAQADAVAQEIASLTDEYEELRAQIRARSPRYAALTQPQPLGLAKIQQQVLDSDTLLLEYSLGDSASHLFVVGQTSITWRQLPKRAEIEAATHRLRELLTAHQPRPGDTEAKYQARVKEAGESYWRQAAELSRMLLGPVASLLGKKRLAIVADGALQYIPFAALPEPSPANDEGRSSAAEPQPLFLAHEIVSLPSASTLATLRRETAGRKRAEKSLAVLADPVFTDDDTRIRRNVSKAGAKERTRSADSDEMDLVLLQMSRSGRETGVIDAQAGFGRLLNTRREATAIAALVPARERKQALDFQASRATALGPDLGEYRIVHFATHGLLNNVHPELSGLVLSLVDEAGQPQDGFLRLQDIYNLKLPAELVVLSACQTGLGKEIKGEGLIGLARGFMYAGAPRVVASLWKVDDRATSELMKRFYQGMLGPEALRPAEALRQAQLSIWRQKQWRAPYYWAAFILQGEWKGEWK